VQKWQDPVEIVKASRQNVPPSLVELRATFDPRLDTASDIGVKHHHVRSCDLFAT
jgi:hypothetical protein